MLTFAFTILSFILFAVAGYFAYRYGKQEMTATMKSHMARSARKDKANRAVIAELQDRLDHTDSMMKQILAQPGNKNMAPLITPNFRDNMEDRAIRENPRVVAVDSVQKII